MLRKVFVFVSVLCLTVSVAQAGFGDVVYSRYYSTTYDLLRNDAPTLAEQASNISAAGLDDGILGMVASSSGDVVMARQYGAAFDLTRFDGDTLAKLNFKPSAQGFDDGFIGIVATADDHVVIARHYSGAYDFIRYDTDPGPGDPGFPNIAETNRAAGAGMDDGILGMVATANGDVVMARHYAGVAGLLRYDGTTLAEQARNDGAMGLDLGFLGMVALPTGDIVMARHWDDGGNDRISLLRFDGLTLAEVARNDYARGIDDGWVGMVSLVPEPATLTVLIFGALLGVLRKRRA